MRCVSRRAVFFFNDTATTEIYTLSLHDALPIFGALGVVFLVHGILTQGFSVSVLPRSEEHTSELQSQSNLVCRLLLEKKNNLGSQSFLPTGLHHPDDRSIELNDDTARQHLSSYP